MCSRSTEMLIEKQYTYYLQQERATHLQETGLSVLEPKECTHFGQSLNANSSIEICTGHKTEFPHIQQYKRRISRDGKWITFKKGKKIKNLLGTNEKDYDFYLGGSDSCQGKCTLARRRVRELPDAMSASEGGHG